MARLRDYYKDTVIKKMLEQFNYSNTMEVPRLEKIVLNMGVGEAANDKKKIEGPYKDLAMITGQKPVICLSKKSIAGFKLREGLPVGCKVTLRKNIMYEFLDRFVLVALPRVRDFRGLSVKGFDGKGSYSMGLKEQIVFPEIDYDKIDSIRGMDITFCTNAKSKEEVKYLLQCFNLPFNE